MPNGIGDRLREERECLGLSQDALARQCGVAPRSQRNYEAGDRLPDAEYLANLLRLGADVNYVLSGTRDREALSKEETVLVANFRHCSPPGKANLMQTSALLAAGMGGSTSMNMSNVGDGNVQVGHAGGNVSGRVKK